MLDIAIKHEEELKEKMLGIWFQDKYKYWNFSTYFEKHKIDDTTWSKHQFVSLDSDGKVIGYIGYNVYRETYDCDGLSIINFTDNISTFGIDLGRALTDIFEKFKFRKLNFKVVIGNPIEKSYDKMIEKYNGRIVGTMKKDVKLIDGEYYDTKLYEIFREDYLEYKVKKDCSTCKNNVEYPPPHTCDICTSLDQEEEYEMWEER